MLLQFNFGNYKSFRQEASLDMTAAKITEFSHTVRNISAEKVLPVAAIYGANASGKTNVIEAFRFMGLYVLNSFGYGGEPVKGVRHILPRTPFVFDKTGKDEASFFEVYYIMPEKDGGKTYNYGFCMDDSGISEEWLNVKARTAREYKRIFYRNGTELDLKGIPKESKENIKVSLEKESLIVSLGSKLKIECLKQVRDWFQNVELWNFGNTAEDHFRSTYASRDFLLNRSVQKDVVKYLSAFDPSIIDFIVSFRTGQTDQIEDIRIEAVHRVKGTEDTASIPLEEESAGTLKMFALYDSFKRAMENGGLLLIDELSSKLHPLLVRDFIISFIDPEINKNGAQLVFTTHDTWHLSNNILRRDEIWFTQKDEDGCSELYSLADFRTEYDSKIRKDENYEKNYLLGKYGSVPRLVNVK